MTPGLTTLYLTIKLLNTATLCLHFFLEMKISVYQHLSAVREIPSLNRDCVWIPLLKMSLLIDVIRSMANSYGVLVSLDIYIYIDTKIETTVFHIHSQIVNCL